MNHQLPTAMLATVPSSGATTEFSIFIASNTKIVSPFFTACPGLALIDKTLPGIGAVTLTLPSLPVAAGAGAACWTAFAGAAAFTGALGVATCFFYSNVINITIYCYCITFHF